MAETPDGQEKSEGATGKKLSDARERGLAAKSVDFTSASILLFGGLSTFILGSSLAERGKEFMRHMFLNAPTIVLNDQNVATYYSQLMLMSAIVILPIVCTIAAIALFAEMRQVGFHFATKKFTEGLNIAGIFNVFGGIKKMLFSSRSLVELGKSIAKLLLVGVVLYTVLSARMGELLEISGKPYQEIGKFMTSISAELLLKVGLMYMAIAIGDFFYQRWKFGEDQKMTKKEVKDENKQSDGDPQIKSRVRQLGRQRLKKIMLQRTRKADVVIANPTHFAVAISYKPGSMSAPLVLAKGVDFLALKMREIATEENIPIVENPPLARALYDSVEPDQEIPEIFFKAVAEILAFVFKMNNKIRRA